ncbi:MAG: hypothetical protein GY861_12740 [bacterium]|nr:hypothetical protein [bacterium]
MTILEQINKFIKDQLMAGQSYPETFYVDKDQAKKLHRENWSPSLKKFNDNGFIQPYNIDNPLAAKTPNLIGMFNKVKVVRGPF